MPPPFRAIVSSLVIVVALLLLVPVVEDFAAARDALGGDGGDGGGGPVEYDQAFLKDTGTLVDVGEGNDVGDNETVYQTTGFAVNLTGASDSEITGDGVADFTNDTDWHVSVWARPDAGSGRTMEVASVSDGELRIYLNESAGHWAAWYYRHSTTDSYEVAAATSEPVGNLTNIQVLANGTHLKIYRNKTLGGVADITQTNTVDAPTEASNWDGRVEELRVFNASLDSANRSELFSDPAEQRPNLGRVSRLMFDQPSQASITYEVISALELTASNVEYSAGFAENVSTDGTDYKFDTDGPQVAPVANGDLDGAPVAYASYDRPAGDRVALTEFTDWLGIAALIPLVLITVSIYSRLSS